MSIFDRLNFTDIGMGDVQSVDEMTIVPLVGPDRGNVAPPQALKFQRTAGYGTMVFENTDDSRPAIVPSHTQVRGASAQDHAMSGSGVVTRLETKHFDNACCIESSQGGYLRSEGNEEDILPITLRKALLNPSKRTEHAYDKLWQDISAWMRGLRSAVRGRSTRSHLRDFYDAPEYKEALETFAAEFEPVDGQIGAIIMFSGVPVGIEIMPSADHWEAYWQKLIRGCYGAEMLRLKQLGKLQPSTLIMPDLSVTNAIEDPLEKVRKVKEILSEFTEHLKAEVIPLIEQIAISDTRRMSTDGNIDTELVLTGNGGGGDILIQDSKPIYLSLVL